MKNKQGIVFILSIISIVMLLLLYSLKSTPGGTSVMFLTERYTLPNDDNIEKVVAILKEVKDFTDEETVLQRLNSNSTIYNPYNNCNRFLVYYSKILDRDWKYFLGSDSNVYDTVFSNTHEFLFYYTGKVEYKGKGVIRESYNAAVSVVVVEDILLKDIELEKVNFGVKSQNYGVIVAFVFEDGFVVYQVDIYGNKISQKQYSWINKCSN